MKVKPEHYEVILTAFRDKLPLVASLKADIAVDPRVKDPTRRLVFDLMYLSGLGKWVCDTLYAYCDDSHIETAMRRAAKELGI